MYSFRKFAVGVFDVEKNDKGNLSTKGARAGMVSADFEAWSPAIRSCQK